MRSLKKSTKLAVATFILAISIALAGCTAEKFDTANATAIIDVRTAEEFQAGHLDGAININVESPNFDQEISELDKVGDYFVYCRSGRRSAIAVSRMSELGFTNLTDLGGLSDASARTGLNVVG